MANYALRPSLLIVQAKTGHSLANLNKLGQETKILLDNERLETALELHLEVDKTAKFFQDGNGYRYKQEYLEHLAQLDKTDKTDCIYIAFHISKFFSRSCEVDSEEYFPWGTSKDNPHRHTSDTPLFV